MTDFVMPANLGDLLPRAGIDDRGVLIDLSDKDRPIEFSAVELEQKIQAFARGLIRAGIKTGDSVGFLAGNRWEMLVGYLATMYMGAVAVPINFKFPGETIRFIVRDSKIRLLFVDQDRSHLAPAHVRRISFDDDGQEGFAAYLDAGFLDVYQPASDDIAEILYTSGSTGMPKGVPLTHAGQIWAVNFFMDPVGANDQGQTSLIVAPLYHMNALFSCTVCLLNGIKLVLQPKFAAKKYIDAVAQYRCTHLSGVPTMYALVASLDQSEMPTQLEFVKKVMIGSAPLSEALLATVAKIFPAAEITNSYGSTEAGPAIFGPHPEGKTRPPLSVGHPFKGVQWRLQGEASPDEGVFIVKTTAMTPGYLNRPEANLQRFQNGWFDSNDIMRRDENGFFYFNTRVDDMFVCGGENIFPGEVERLLDRHAMVKQSLVVGAPDDLKGMVPVAFVVPMKEGMASEEDIKAFALEHGPAYAHPRRIVFKSVLPLGGTFKIDRKTLELEAARLMQEAGRASPEK